MNDTADELAALIADTLAWCHAYSGVGGRVFPVGTLPELPAAEPWPRVEARAAPETTRRAEPPRAEPPRAEPPRAEPAREPVGAEPPRPAPARPASPEPVRPAPARTTPAPAASPPRVEAPRPAPAPPPAQPAEAPRPLGGKWAAFLRNPQVALDEVWAEVGDCRRCTRCESRRVLVRGVGSAQADLLVVTDPPTADNERSGLTLAPKEREMLDNMAFKVLGLEPARLYVVPALFCASPRLPTAPEIAACRPQLVRLIETIRPRAVLTLGETAASVLIEDPVRGAFGIVSEIPVMPTFHPGWLLANPGDKRATLDHLQALKRRLDR